ncbi:glucosamine-6-phosphate deaminase [Alicyclobacillus fastidiosus]|uniref:Glucosamine-6-phosphate deaminase n=1 Tax=Alicyclobacillus fastidiosus TaxID=392011 RepID=A0ABY6ZE71_9BACL|nr:glucosamine-6-phosphate deaminase [Alicyclobacillus fastidiosus]WAH41142.1 glucosamine-6-phosphate deaminase [Alicyclobacillus fastidiosus]GMA62704.1 glucosamine-6-phosphate deaminase [Alicyclobacillus fastidiosus]
MNIRVFPDQYGAAIYAAATIETTVKTSTSPVLGLATGGTMTPVYRQLVEFHRRGLNFSHVTTINLDEYVGLKPSHPNSYHAFMQENLFDHIDVNPDRIYLPSGDNPDLEGVCAAYDDVIRSNPIDLQLLGIGVNGHIGFNEPANSLKSNTHIVQLTEDTIRENARFFEDEQSVPTRAITVGLQSILLAKHILLLAFGEKKAQAIRDTIKGDISTTVPSSFLQVHPNVTIVLDEAAAQLL